MSPGPPVAIVRAVAPSHTYYGAANGRNQQLFSREQLLILMNIMEKSNDGDIVKFLDRRVRGLFCWANMDSQGDKMCF